jgi:hypothetical protein
MLNIENAADSPLLVKEFWAAQDKHGSRRKKANTAKKDKPAKKTRKIPRKSTSDNIDTQILKTVDEMTWPDLNKQKGIKY